METKGNFEHTWDTWYVRQLLYYAPFFFQRPFWSKTRGRKIKEEDDVYLYHMFTYQTTFRDGELWALSKEEIRQLCGNELERMKYFTPQKERHTYSKLPPARKALTRMAFAEDDAITIAQEHQQFVGDIVSKWRENNQTDFQIKHKSLEAYQKQFTERFGYKLTRGYILKCIEAEMETVEWWKKEDMQRLRRGRTLVGRQRSIPIARPIREGVKKMTRDSSQKREIIDETNYDSLSGEDKYESDTSSDEEMVRKKIIENDYQSSGGSDIYESNSSSEEDETKSDIEINVTPQVGAMTVIDISDDDVQEDTVTLTKNCLLYTSDAADE